jgi:SecD/SecF fusion protein
LSKVKRDAAILVLVAILLGIFAWRAFPLGERTNLGLDLQGGLSVILQAQPTTAHPVITSDDMDQAVKIIQDRVNKLGAAEPDIQRQGADKISVQLPGINNADQALSIIGQTASLEFFDVKDFGAAYTSQDAALKAAGVASLDKLPKGTEIIHWAANVDATTADQWFVTKTLPAVTGGDLKDASWTYGDNNAPQVNMTFNAAGTKKFATITQTLADRAQLLGTDQKLVIVLDGEVKSAPRVQEAITGGEARITGSFTVDQVKALSLVLKTGALPVALTAVTHSNIGATLGKSALNQALLAGLIGLALTILFMIGYYRLPGLVASVALVIYGVLFIGILNVIGVTMTLPGIAGMILTVGMAVDANVLIFARMRDEVAAGKTVGAATSAGFRKALRAVIDCNVTTIITAIVLFWAASGGIKGFALTLGIGVALSMFTAVLVSRSMLQLLSGWRPFRNPKLLGLHVNATKKWRIYPFMRYRWWFLGTLGVVTVFALLTIFVVGLDFGIDFKGGSRVQVGLEQTATVDQVRAAASAQGIKDAVVQEVSGTSGTHSFMITFRGATPAVETTQANALIAALNTAYTVQPGSTATDQVYGSFSSDTTNRAFIACAIAIIAIIGYLTIRFAFKFAIPAIVALLHDVGLALGVYAATGRLVTSATVAAILTILGYSVHDTIIVFDRIRENTLVMKKETYAEMVDLSIRQTLNRSINTSIAILLPLVAILFFGGPTLKDFAFALTIGVLTGTYSSFFVASPLVVLWKSREPRYRKRMALAGAGGATVVVDDAVAEKTGPKSGAAKAVPAKTTQSSGAARTKPSNGKPGSKPGASSKGGKGKTTSKRPPGK